MNKRIEMLFKQAGGYVEVDDKGNYFTYTQDFDPETFANLIVKECDRYARSVWEHGPLLGRDLLIHFGVEEMSDE